MRCAKCNEFSKIFFLMMEKDHSAMVTGASGKWICKSCLKKELE